MKSRKRKRRSRDKRGAQKLTPKRAELEAKRRRESESTIPRAFDELFDEVFNQS